MFFKVFQKQKNYVLFLNCPRQGWIYYMTVPGAPRLGKILFYSWCSPIFARKMQRISNEDLFLVFTSIWLENAANIPKVPGSPRNVNPALTEKRKFLTDAILARPFILASIGATN